jgi:hypothetical protein
MKKTLVIVCILFLSLSTGMVFGSSTHTKTTTASVILNDNKENKLSAEEISCLKNRVEEIRNMDKSVLTRNEKSELRNELKGIRESVRRSDGVIYIGGGTLLLVIILIIILL